MYDLPDDAYYTTGEGEKIYYGDTTKEDRDQRYEEKDEVKTAEKVAGNTSKKKKR